MTNLTFSPLQERAIDAIVQWYGDPLASQEFVLHGYAGTGKSTVVAEAISRLKHIYGISNIPTGAYTGKAAHVLRKKGNTNSSTVHGLIYTVAEDPDTHDLISILNPIGPAAMADLIVLDEVSMLGDVIANDLRSFGKKMLCMGDPGQLPPINGEGAFNRKPDFFLDEIHRQALDSPIIELATMARNGQYLPIGYSKNGVHVKQFTTETEELLHNPDTQVLCGLNRIKWGATQIMRRRLGFNEQFPMPGERIICKKNNKPRGLFNGAIGVLEKMQITPAGGFKITGDIEGNYQKDLLSDPYLFRQHFDNGVSKRSIKPKYANEFDWAACVSVHSAQGSSWPDVTLIDNSDSFRESKWKHLYTGITRAEENLTILMM
jgi:exodeoxyribonuclease-5